MTVFHKMLGTIVSVFVDTGIVVMEQKHLGMRQEQKANKSITKTHQACLFFICVRFGNAPCHLPES